MYHIMNQFNHTCLTMYYIRPSLYDLVNVTLRSGERGGSVVECRTPEREVGGSKPTAAVLCPWARHFTPRKYWLITQEAMAPSRHDWKIVDWDVKPQHKQNFTKCIGYNTNCIGAHLIWLRNGTNTVGIVTNTFHKVTLTKL